MSDPAEASPDSSSSAKPRLKLILMGTGPFAVPTFEAVRTSGHEVELVVTRPLHSVRSRKGPPPSPVRQWADEHQLAIFDPTSINDDETVERLQSVDADLSVVCDYGQILKPAALEATRLGGINLHGSLLPKFRGAAPVQWALLSGESITGVSVIHMTPKLDGGPILTTRSIEIRDDETAGELEERLAQLGVEASLEAIGQLQTWDGESLIGQVQDKTLATKAPRLKKTDGELDWNSDARAIDCHVRGMQPWPVAFTHLRASNDRPPIRLAIRQVTALDRPSQSHSPGEIVADPNGDLTVAAADQIVRIDRLQPAGKKEMSGREFCRGHQIAPGTVLSGE